MTNAGRVLRSVAMGYLAEPDSMGMLHDQAVRRRTGTDMADDGEITAPEPDRTTEACEPAEPVEAPDVFTRRLPATTVYLHLDRETQTWSMDDVGPITPAEAEQVVGTPGSP